MKNSVYLSVIIPAYNEAKRISLTLIDVNKHLSKANFTYEIIVVDNNSKDATKEIAERFSHIIKNLRVIECPIQGKANAVKMGMLSAKGDIRLFTDADNSTSIDQVYKMFPYFEKGYNIVIGSRDVEEAKLIPSQPWYRRLGGNIGNLVIQALLLPGIWDTQCGFKALTAEVAEKIFSMAKIRGWGFDAEILALAKTLGYKIKEIPVVWVNSPFSHVKASAYLEVLWEVFKIRWWLTTNRYKIRKARETVK
ncbi:MAG: glycosyltransferase family 2 protein [Patescibacteria group bacterium]|nr:glycosyltransferase family 2 protein [Patescibacteria group bacterium]